MIEIVVREAIVLRSWRIEDASNLMLHANDKSVWDGLRDTFPHPYTFEDAQNWILQNHNINPPHEMALEINGNVAGAMGVRFSKDIYRCNAELGYWLGKPYWGQGIITDAIRAFLPYVFEHFELISVFACVMGNNTASLRALEKAGFELVDRRKDWVIKNGVVMDELTFRFFPG